jgi:hypothetical protein
MLDSLRTLRTFLISTALLVAASPVAYAAVSSPGEVRLISPRGLGSGYAGITGAGEGLPSPLPKFGFAAGTFILQPRLLLESQFSSNFFKNDSRVADEVMALAFRIRPGIGIFNPDYDWFGIKFGLDLDVFVPASDDDSVMDQTNVGVSSLLSIDLFSKSAFSLVIEDQFKRELLVRPISARNAVAHRNFNSAGMDVAFHPGGGALDFRTGYRYNLLRYDEMTDSDSDVHKMKFVASWRFLPLDYLFLDVDFAYTDYKHERTAEEAARAGNYDIGMPIKAILGLSGYFTERIALLLKVGYGNSLLETGEDFSSFIGQLQGSFRFTERSVLHVGGQRDFNVVQLGGYAETIRAYASFEQNIADVVLLHFDFGLDYRMFGQWTPAPFLDETSGDTLEVTVSDAFRTDIMLNGGLMADFDISRAFGLTAGYRIEADLTDYAVITDGDVQFQGYMEHRAYISFNLRY